MASAQKGLAPEEIDWSRQVKALQALDADNVKVQEIVITPDRRCLYGADIRIFPNATACPVLVLLIHVLSGKLSSSGNWGSEAHRSLCL